MGYIPMCYVCSKAKVETGPEGECISDICVGLRNRKSKPIIWFGAVLGGTRENAHRRAFEIQFKKDQEAYYNARKAGERPEACSVEGVEKTRRKKEVVDRVMKRDDILKGTEQELRKAIGQE